ALPGGGRGGRAMWGGEPHLDRRRHLVDLVLVLVVRPRAAAVLVLLVIALELVSVGADLVVGVLARRSAKQRAACPPPCEVPRALDRAGRHAVVQRAKREAGEQHDAQHPGSEQEDRRARRPDRAREPAANRDAEPAPA